MDTMLETEVEAMEVLESQVRTQVRCRELAAGEMGC